MSNDFGILHSSWRPNKTGESQALRAGHRMILSCVREYGPQHPNVSRAGEGGDIHHEKTITEM